MMYRRNLPWLLALTIVGLGGCDPDDDQSNQGTRAPCATPTGNLFDCDTLALESPEDVCWRLVECGSIPVEEPVDREWVWDWKDCVASLAGLPDFRFDFVVSCVENSICDDLKFDGSPDSVSFGNGTPLCLQYGDQ